MPTEDSVQVSVVIPCLNEEKSLGICIEKAKTALIETGLTYEIVVSDNGSTDRSRDIAVSRGARVVTEPLKGYGMAYITGINHSRGSYIVMADGDNTYDFSDIQKFITPLEKGYDFVIGSRFKGHILNGAMSWSHRYIGNPVLSSMLKIFFRTEISDSHCGYRSFTRAAFKKMRLKTRGMEFASEMVVNAIKEKLLIKEVPIDYFPRIGESKLESLRDAWRHIRFMLLYAPSWLYLAPGVSLLGIGLLLVTGFPFGQIKIMGHLMQSHFNILGVAFSLLGSQIVSLGIFARSFSYLNGFDRFDLKIAKFLEGFRLEKGLLVGAGIFLCGIAIFAYILIKWIRSDFGALEEFKTGLLATTLTILGTQLVFSSFFLSFLIQEKRPPDNLFPQK